MSEKKIDLADATATVTLEIDGDVYLVLMEKDRLEAINTLIKAATVSVIPANITQHDLQEFLIRYAKGEDGNGRRSNQIN